MFERLKDTNSYHKKMSDALKTLEYIVSKFKCNLINVFRLDSEEGSQDIEMSILRAFLNCDFFCYLKNLMDFIRKFFSKIF